MIGPSADQRSPEGERVQVKHNATPEGRSVRLQRVAEQVRHALSDALARGEVDDPVLASHSVSITEVRMSPDLRLATVYAKPLLGADEADVLKALRANAKPLRGAVSKRVNLKYAAELRFRADESFEVGDKIDQLLRDPHVAQDLTGE